MPRTPAVPPEEVLETLLLHDIYDNNVLRKETHPVWKNICELHNNLLKPKSLHIYVMQDRNNCQTLYRKLKGLKGSATKRPKLEPPPEIEDVETFSDEDIPKEDDGQEFDPYEKKPRSWEIKCKIKKKLTFDITLTPQQWAHLKPIQKVLANGVETMALQAGWTDVFRDMIWNSQQLPCSFSFKHHKVDKFDGYIKVIGKCISCHGHISCMCFKPPSEGEPVTFTVVTADSRNIPHTKKITLKGLARVKVKEELKRKNPQQWRMEKVEKAMKKGHCESPFLYDLPTLRRVREDKKTTKSKVQPEKNISELFPNGNFSSTTNADMQVNTEGQEKDLFESLHNIQQNTNCKDFVKSIGFNKFHVIYCSPEQLKIHNDIQTLLSHSLYLDTTTGIAQNINRPDGNNEIFLSILYTYIDDKFVPLTQVLTEKNDFLFYTSWLMDWKESVTEKPKQIVTNMHRAIQDAVCMTLNGMCFRLYNDLCLQILSGKEVLMTIPTQIKTNSAHFEYTILNWSCLSDLKPKVKEFYKKSVRFITTIDDLNIFSQFLRCLMVVSSSKIYHEECHKASRYLMTLMRSYNFHQHANKIVNAGENIDDIKKLENGKFGGNLDIKCDFIKNFIDNIKKDVELIIVNNNDEDDLGTQDNDYYSPDFADQFYNLCEDFPCWTNVMHNYFNNPADITTLRKSKIYFKNFKDSLGESLFRVDKVLIKHCYDISNEMKDISTVLNNLVGQEIIDDSCHDAPESEILHSQNDHQSNEQEIEFEVYQPENDHQSNENDHQSNENDHQSNENDHQSNENDHQSNENNHQCNAQEMECEQLSITPTKTIIQQNVPVINQNKVVTISNSFPFSYSQDVRLVYVHDPHKQNKNVHIQTNEVDLINGNNMSENICLDFTKNFVFNSPM